MSEKLEKRPLADWRSALLRVTAFLGADDSARNRDLWADLRLGEPDSAEKKKGQVTVQGPALDHWLIVTSVPGRIDWLYLPSPQEPDEIEFGMRDVGSFIDATDQFIRRIGGWLEAHSPHVMRIAYGPTIRLPVANRNSGYRQISSYLPFELTGEGESDFLYQINRWRKSSVVGVGGMKVNRLTKWSVVLHQELHGQITIGGSGLLPSMRSGDSECACQAILDVNSDPEHVGGFDGVTADLLLKEFAKFALEVAEKGDIP